MNVLELNPYGDHDIETLSAIWEPKKEYIEKDLWVIRNFFSEEELAWLMEQANDPNDWYTVMRSEYGGNIKNKFLEYEAEYDENGIMILPGPNSNFNISNWSTWPIHNRFISVVPKHFGGAGALQSFFEVPDSQIVSELGHDVDYAMDFHYERDDEYDGRMGHSAKPGESQITAAVSVYINDDYEGGELEFKHKKYSIKPERGMLVNIPLYHEFEHRVAKVRNGTRHTVYGSSWDNLGEIPSSTNKDC